MSRWDSVPSSGFAETTSPARPKRNSGSAEESSSPPCSARRRPSAAAAARAAARGAAIRSAGCSAPANMRSTCG